MLWDQIQYLWNKLCDRIWCGKQTIVTTEDLTVDPEWDAMMRFNLEQHQRELDAFDKELGIVPPAPTNPFANAAFDRALQQRTGVNAQNAWKQAGGNPYLNAVNQHALGGGRNLSPAERQALGLSAQQQAPLPPHLISNGYNIPSDVLAQLLGGMLGGRH